MTSVDQAHHYHELRLRVDRRLRALVRQRSPRDLTAALRYILSGSGKRVRSTLLLLSCEAVGGSVKHALNAAMAVELLHEFTLVHDDIMDHATSRRGRPAVHIKWDVNNALLAGDVLLALAYRSLQATRKGDPVLLNRLFTEGLLGVCEGQALDLERECGREGSLGGYFDMIEKKTAALITMSAQLGGVVGGATKPELNALKRFGLHLGRAFQIQDDLLDVIADEKDFGKVIGGDIVEGKRTFLLLKALERAGGKDRLQLNKIIGRKPGVGATPLAGRARVRIVTSIYHKHGVIEEAKLQVQRETKRAIAALNGLARNRGTASLRWFSEMLLRREF